MHNHTPNKAEDAFAIQMFSYVSHILRGKPKIFQQNQKHTSHHANINFNTVLCRWMLICWIAVCVFVCVSLAAFVRQPSALWELLSSTQLADSTS